MLSSSQERLLRWVYRVYGLMLLAYPSTFRRGYSREMLVVFRTRARDTVQQHGSWALLPLMLHIGWDWVHTSLRENASRATSLHAVRWFAALPLAILAAGAAQRMAGFFIRTDFQHVWITAGLASFLMSAAFVSVGVWVAPSRKDSVARIALGVVVFWAVVFIALGAFMMTPTPLFWGGCALLGGVVGYLPWRQHDPPQVET